MRDLTRAERRRLMREAGYRRSSSKKGRRPGIRAITGRREGLAAVERSLAEAGISIERATPSRLVLPGGANG